MVSLRRLKLSLLFLVILSLLTTVAQAQGDPASQIILLVNQLRASYGFSPYQVDPILTSVAQAHASWLAANNLNSHLGPDGSNPDERAKAAGYGAGYNAFVIENQASGTLELHTPELVVSMWQGDTGHLNAMISPNYEHVGVGYAEGFGMSWFVMMVGWTDERKPADDAAEEAPGTSGSNGLYLPFVTSTPETSGALYHKVQSGQSAWTIAVEYQVDLGELLTMNNLYEESILLPGDLLLIRPAPIPTSTLEPTPPPPTAPASATASAQPPSPTQDPDSTPAINGTPVLMEDGETTPESNRLGLLLGIGGGLILLVFLIFRFQPRLP